MDPGSAALLALQHVSPLVKVAVVGKLARMRLVERYAFLCGALVVSAACQAWLLGSWWVSGSAAYRNIWRIVTPIQVAASLAMGVEALWLLVSHFPKRRNLMVAMVCLCGLVSAATVLPTSAVLPGEGWMAIRRHWKAGVWMVLAVARVILSEIEPNMRANVRWHTAAVLLAIGGTAVGDAISAAFPRDYWPQAAGRLVMIGAPIAAARWWWRMEPSGEDFTPTPRPSLEDLDPEWERVTKAIERARGQAAGE